MAGHGGEGMGMRTRPGGAMPVTTPGTMPHPGLRLLTLLIAAETVLAGAGLTAAVLLIHSTTRMRHIAAEISRAVESVYLTEESERLLLVHARQSYLLGVTGDGEPRRRRELARRDFEVRMALLPIHVSSPREAESLAKANENAAHYFAERERMEGLGWKADAIAPAVTDVLDEAQASLGALVQINYEQARGFQQQVQAEDAVANRIGAAAAVGVVLALGGVFVLLHRGLRQPLVALVRQMRGLESGNLAHFEPHGPAELREVAAVFNDLLARLRAQREAQLRFLAGIAHDLRTPLTAIKLSGECLADETLSEDGREIVRGIDRQVTQLDRQVGDLLDTTRIESGQLALRFGEHDLAEIVEDAAGIFRGLSAKHTVRLSMPPEPLLCRMDATRIGQVVNNLLSNAIKYSPVGGEVSVAVSCDGVQARVAISDEGIGIGPDDLPHIFEPFRRTASTRDAIPGVGLGLSVAKKIIEAHGGAIEVRSVRGAGTTFTLRLPCAEPAESATAVPKANS